MIKMEKKGVFMAILIILVLTLSGCKTTRDEPSEINYRTGTEGLTVTFPTDTPTELYENDNNVRFIVEVRNKGAFPQNEEIGDFNGKLWIGGYDDSILTITPLDSSSIGNGVELKRNELEGKSVYNRDGGYSAVEFKANINDLPDGMPVYEPTIIVTATYKYTTIANPIICVDPEPRSTRVREKVCSIEDSISVGSQGAPIAVTRVEESVTSNDFLFKIFIENLGNGFVIPTTEVGNDPNKGYDWRNTNTVKRGKISVGDIPMTECRPDINIQLIDGKGYIFCRLNKGVNSAISEGKTYETALNIKLDYGYTTSEEKKIKIFEEVSFS